ncbi:hypothetical protein V8F06_009909 [Rhypophila decipiens]
MFSFIPFFVGLLALAIPHVFGSPAIVPLVRDAPPLPPVNVTTGASAPSFYSGPWQNFPAFNGAAGAGRSFDDLFNLNRNSMRSTGSTEDDVNRIKVGIRQSANQIGVDNRVILAIIMQESHGNVGVVTNNSPGGIVTAGIMQCMGYPGYPGQHGLSQDQITAMIRGGTQQFKQNLVNWGNIWTGESYYPALREYNSGSVNPNDLSDGRGATASYVSDVVQRLQGWVN